MQSEDAAACDVDEDPMADDEFELEMEREFQRRADDAEKMGRLSAAVASRDSSLDRDQGKHEFLMKVLMNLLFHSPLFVSNQKIFLNRNCISSYHSFFS